MKEIILKIKEMKLEEFDAPGNKAKFSVVYFVDEREVKNIVLVNFKEKLEDISEGILKMVKSGVSVKADESDFVGSLFVKRLVNDDKVWEKIYNYLAKVCDKLRALKNEKNHADYMKLYHELRGSSLVF